MSTLLHISDIHFGRVNHEVMEALRQEIYDIRPDRVVVSGDFTQVASEEEFAAARDYLNSFSAPVFTVPGNHDVPAFNLWARFFSPYKLYKKYINEDLCPVHEDEDYILVGLNTARRFQPHWNWAHGRVSNKQIDMVRDYFAKAPTDKYRILVCHHPLKEFEDMPIKTIVWGSDKLRSALLEHNVNMVLTGHVHHASLTYEKDEDAEISYVGATTATSDRLRTHNNGYNLIKIKDGKALIEHRTWNGSAFGTNDFHTQRKTSG